jgi:hypothetical protein
MVKVAQVFLVVPYCTVVPFFLSLLIASTSLRPATYPHDDVEGMALKVA